MGHLHCIEKAPNEKHLTYRERVKIEVLLKQKQSTQEIAEFLGRSQRTIQREIKRGQVQQLNGATWEYYMAYSADLGHVKYMDSRGGSGPRLKIGHDHALCVEIERQIKMKRSPDIIAHDIRKRANEFTVTLCTRTIYNYLAKNIFREVDDGDLIYGRYGSKGQKKPPRPSYKNLMGRSIEERPAEVEAREEAGHWEMDLVVGSKTGGKACLLALTERKSRREILHKLPDKSQRSVIHALDKMERKMGHKAFAAMFRSLTVDNGSEFLNSSEMERSCLPGGKQRTQVYYAHPYAAYERGSNENMNRMIRRFIPKGSNISKLSKKEIKRIEHWLNTYPRKILDYQTPLEAYELSA